MSGGNELERDTLEGTPVQQLELRVRHALDHVGHVLPDQAPIRVFIHHNTLHAFEHLHFHRAVKAAQAVYGAEPYLSEAVYREKLHVGRIGTEDLSAALHDQYRDAVDDVFVPFVLSTKSLRLLMLRFQLHRETDVTLAWHKSERALTRKVRSDAPNESRNRLLLESETSLRASLKLPGSEGVSRFTRPGFGLSRRRRSRS